MSGFQQVLIGGYPSGGLTTDKKPLMLANEAFSNLRNAYVFRDRTKKRDGMHGIDRLRRFFTTASLGTSGASPWSFNIYSTVTGAAYFPITPEPNAEIQEGSVIISIGTTILRDNGNGTLSQTGNITGATNANPGVITSTAHGLTTGDQITISGVQGMTQLNGNTYTVTVVTVNTFSIGVNTTAFGVYTGGGSWISLSTFGTINYLTGNVVITYTRAATAATISFGYYPSLQVMGIWKRDIPTIGIDQTVFFDTKYAYQFVSGGFQEIQPGQVWTAPNNSDGTNTFFFWATNYQGITPSQRYFFATNDNITLGASTPYDPIYYLFNSVWTALQPQLDAVPNFLYQALIVIPHYGRLLAFNTWEGPKTGGDFDASKAVNYYARCRGSAIGNPIVTGAGSNANAWRTDIFGQGFFLDAPTNESIVSVAFFRNTLIVFFEYSTWQLRYLGEYGLPFIFERISSDFGSVSTFSSIVFDQGVMTVSDRGIIQASAAGLTRLDEQIPETAFSFEIQNNAPDFVHGARDFEKEVVYWNYYDTTDPGEFQVFPNTTLLFNYKNNTWAQFRDTITCFGPGQFQFEITWDSLTTFWDSEVSWDTSDDQNYVDYITCGNQQGYISVYENQEAATASGQITMFAPSLAITAFTLLAASTTITVPNHNLDNYEFIYLTGALWSGTDPGFNNFIYQVQAVDQNTLTLFLWNQETLSYSDVVKTSSATYIGGGRVALLPIMDIVGKDFSPFQGAGKGFKLSYIDFQMDSNIQLPSIPAVTVQLFVNSNINTQANVLIGNKEVQNSSQVVGFVTNIFTGTASLTNPSNPCQITSPDHCLISGSVISFGNILGTTQLNSGSYTITVVDANNFTLNNIDATGFTAYAGGGSWYTLDMDGQAYTSGSQYAWYRFYSTQYGQYLRIGLTYDDVLMNQLATHQTPMELNAMNIWFREGGRLVN
jgi:Ubiquitin-activating enzyme E1 FCCH domain